MFLLFEKFSNFEILKTPKFDDSGTIFGFPELFCVGSTMVHRKILILDDVGQKGKRTICRQLSKEKAPKIQEMCPCLDDLPPDATSSTTRCAVRRDATRRLRTDVDLAVSPWSFWALHNIIMAIVHDARSEVSVSRKVRSAPRSSPLAGSGGPRVPAREEKCGGPHTILH